MNTETIQTGSETAPESEASANALGEGLQRVVESTRQLLKSTADAASESVATARSQLKDKLGGAGEKLEATQMRIAEKVRHSADVAKGYAEENPWKVAGASALAGLLAGYLVSRRVGASRHSHGGNSGSA